MNELKCIQFYLGKDIVFYCELMGGKFEIIQGEIKIVDGCKREQIIFECGILGVFLFSFKNDCFVVSFEDGGEDCYFIFGLNFNVGNCYVLLVSDWNCCQGVVSYAG